MSACLRLPVKFHNICFVTQHPKIIKISLFEGSELFLKNLRKFRERKVKKHEHKVLECKRNQKLIILLKMYFLAAYILTY